MVNEQLPCPLPLLPKPKSLFLNNYDVFSTKDTMALASKCGHIGTKRNCTTLRTLYYPPLQSDDEIEDMPMRCGEHSDYGAITLLFQDTTGGLEVS